MTRAGLAHRAVARFADVVLVTVPAFLVLAPLLLAVLPDARTTTAVTIGLCWVVVVAYETIFTAAAGQTIGKRAVGLRVVMVGTERPPSAPAAFLRAALPMGAGIVGLGVGWLVPYLWAFVHPLHRGLHDLVAGTEVVVVEIG